MLDLLELTKKSSTLCLAANTSDEATEILKQANLVESTYDRIATRVNQRVSDRVENKIKISVVIVSMDGKVLGMDQNARCNQPWLNLT